MLKKLAYLDPKYEPKLQVLYGRNIKEHPILDKGQNLEFLDMKIDLLKTHKELQDRSFITPQLLVNPQIKPCKIPVV